MGDIGLGSTYSSVSIHMSSSYFHFIGIPTLWISKGTIEIISRGITEIHKFCRGSKESNCIPEFSSYCKLTED
jgi:hypothetical protein